MSSFSVYTISVLYPRESSNDWNLTNTRQKVTHAYKEVIVDFRNGRPLRVTSLNVNEAVFAIKRFRTDIGARSEKLTACRGKWTN